MLRLLARMVQQHVPVDRRDLRVSVDVGAVVREHRYLDQADQPERRPGRLPERGAGVHVRIGDEHVAFRHAVPDHAVEPPEQFLMLALLLGNAGERVQGRLPAGPLAPRQLGRLQADELLEHREHVRVGAPLDLAEQAALGLCEKVHRADPGQPVGQELEREVEPAAAHDIAIDVEAQGRRHFPARCGPRRIHGLLGDLHGVVSRAATSRPAGLRPRGDGRSREWSARR